MDTAANSADLGPGHSQGFAIPINRALSLIHRSNGQGGG